MPRTSTLLPEFPSDQFVGNFVEYMMPVDETMENRSEEGDVDVELEIEEDEEIIEEEREVDNHNEEAECVGFQSEINPLDFVEDEDAGVQLYKQFERIEYEALAKRKRDAEHQSEGLSKKPRLGGETTMMNYEEMLEAMTYGGKRRRRRSGKLRGRRKGSKNKLNPEVSRKLGEATLHYARGNHEEAIKVLNEVVLRAPNLPYPYHRLGSVYNDVGAKKKAIACYMIAAFLSPKDTSLWKHLLDLSIEQGYIGQAWYCLSKAITADPGDISLRRCRASLSLEVEDYGKAAESYDQIFRLCPDDFDALNNAIMLYNRCSKLECGVNILKWYVKEHGYKADLSMVDMLVSLCIENHNYSEALQHIENTKKVLCPGSEWLMYLTIKEGICCAHLGNMEKAEVCFSLLQQVNAVDHVHQILAVADTLMALQRSECAFNYYKMLEGKLPETGSLYLKIAKCCLALKRRKLAIEFFYKALLEEEGDVEVRLMLASVLLDEGSDNEAISLLSSPPNAGFIVVHYSKFQITMFYGSYLSLDRSLLHNLMLCCSMSGLVKEYDSNISIPWWLNARIKLKLSSIYKSKGMHEAFVDVVFPLVHKSLVFEVESQKVRRMKRLSSCTLKKRVKVLDDSRKDFLFHNFRPLANRSDKSKANRAKRKLESETAKKEKKKSAALAAGLDWISDDSDEDNEEVAQEPKRESPFPNLLKDEEHCNLIEDLCNELSSMERYAEALDIIKLILEIKNKKFRIVKKEKYRYLGSEIALKLSDPSVATELVTYMIRKQPRSIAAWNACFKIVSRIENQSSKRNFFRKIMRLQPKGFVPPKMITGNVFTTIRWHQAAVRQYLEAYKLTPESPLINLCVGTALVNLACGHRIHNKHQCIVQGLAFLYNNLQLSGDTQETLYNIARAFHQVGLFTLAASYYEKVLAIDDKNFQFPDNSELGDPPTKKDQKPVGSDLRREAAYNLHLIYNKSGATDLARQLLKDYCTL